MPVWKHPETPVSTSNERNAVEDAPRRRSFTIHHIYTGGVNLADDEIAMIGAINLDYRSLVHHFENGVWMYRCDCVQEIRADFDQTFEKSIFIDAAMANPNLPRRALRAMVKVFSPLL